MRVGVFFTEFFFTVFSGCYPPLCGKVFLLSILMGHYLVLLGFYGLDCARRAHENHLGLTVGGGGGISAEECAGREKKSENSSLVHGSNQSEWSILCRNVSSIIYCSYLKKKRFCV